MKEDFVRERDNLEKNEEVLKDNYDEKKNY